MSAGKPGKSARSRSRICKQEIVQEEDSATQVTVPQLAWKILSQEDVGKLNTLTPNDLADELASVLKLKNHKKDLREAAILDYYVAGYWFAQETGFNEQQQSAFFTILYELFEEMKNKRVNATDTLHTLEAYLKGVGISNQTPLQCFTLETAQQTLGYVADNMLQHYELFEYILREEQESEDIPLELEVHLPPVSTSLCPAPLEEAVTEDFYSKCIVPPSISSATASEPLDIESKDHKHDSTIVLTDSPVSLINVSPDTVRKIVNNMASEYMSSYQDTVLTKLKERESNYTTKLSKVEKLLH